MELKAPDFRKREDKLSGWLDGEVRTFLFDSFSDDYCTRTGMEFLRGVDIPIKPGDLAAFHGEGGLPVTDLADNMACVMGANTQFKYRDAYIAYLALYFNEKLVDVLAVFALNFNYLFTEYDMSATFASSYGTTYAMVIQSMCREEGLQGYNVNASGRRCASTVFIMLVSGLILYLVYGVGARDLGERLDHRKKRRERWDRFRNLFRKNAGGPATDP